MTLKKRGTVNGVFISVLKVVIQCKDVHASINMDDDDKRVTLI